MNLCKNLKCDGPWITGLVEFCLAIETHCIKERYMLILKLKEGEAIQISDDIVIRFNDIHQKQIKVASEAPIDMPVRNNATLSSLLTTCSTRMCSL